MIKNARNYTSTPLILRHGVVLSQAPGQLYLTFTLHHVLHHVYIQFLVQTEKTEN